MTDQMTDEREREYPIARLFNLRLLHIGILSDLTVRTGKNRSQLVQEAIEDLDAKYEKDQPNATTAGR